MLGWHMILLASTLRYGGFDLMRDASARASVKFLRLMIFWLPRSTFFSAMLPE